MSKIWEALKKAEQGRAEILAAQASAGVESASNAWIAARAAAVETRRSGAPARAGWRRRSRIAAQR